MSNYHILLVDDHKIILDSLSLLLDKIADFEVVQVFEDSREVLPYLENHSVDIVITDNSMPFLNGLDLCLSIKARFPTQKILILTMLEDAINIKEAIKAGVSGYILKRTGKIELEHALKAIMAGKKYYSQDVIEELAVMDKTDLNECTPAHILHLTAREIEVITHIAQEFTSAEIAELLFISLATVETHRSNIMKKLQVKSSIGVAKYALKHKLIES